MHFYSGVDRNASALARVLALAKSLSHSRLRTVEIKIHKSQLASDRTSCRSPIANQVRLVLHTAASWLMLTVRDTIPKSHALATAEFATLRSRLLKLGARVIEAVSRVRLAFAAACPEADLFRSIAIALQPAGP